MDPIHPIVPVPPRIPPVTPAPMIGRVDRDPARSPTGEDKRRRRRAHDVRDAAAHYDGEVDYAADDADGEDDSGLHINVTA
jgi:hypothetical protein